MKGEKAKSKRDRGGKLSIKPWLIVLAVTVGIVALIAAYHFGRIWIDDLKAESNVLTFEYSGGKYYDAVNGITYTAAPRSYAYAAKSEERYAKSERGDLYYVCYKDSDGGYHAASPTSWLTTDVEHGAILYYNADKVAVPEPSEFKWNDISLCNPDGKLYATHKLDASVTYALMTAYYGAAEEDNLYSELYGTGQLELLKEIRVTSTEYKYMHMVLYLFGDGEGRYYIGSAYESRLTETDSEVFAPIFEGAK